MTVRKVITRSKKTFRVKFPSKKNKCMIHCESILERDAALYLEMSHQVKSYKAQPSVETYYDNELVARLYFPDFEAILTDDSSVHIEVKPSSKLSRPDLKGKLEAIFRRYQEQGRRFRILTEKDVRSEPLHSNLKLLAYHTREQINAQKFEALKQVLKQLTSITIAKAAAIIGEEKDVYSLIASGYLATNLNQPINQSSLIWIRNHLQGDENDSIRL